jgi:DNA repair exonuclease SbcCD nuclease subunit
VIVFTSDIHFHISKTKDHIPLETIFDVIDQIVAYCIKNQIQRIWILGDLFHIRGKIPVVVFNKVYDKFKEITKLGINIGILSGNHDYVFDSSESTTSVYSLQQIDKVTLLDWEILKIENCSFICIPYLRNISLLKEKINYYKKNIKTNRILLTHGTVRNSLMDNGIKNESGLENEDLTGFDLALVGHIHRPQKLADGKIIIPGSPLCHNKRDLNSPIRGFWVLNCTTLKISFVPTEHPKFYSFSISTKKELSEVLLKIKKSDFVYLNVLKEIDVNFDEIIEKFPRFNVFYTSVSIPQENRLDISPGDSEEKIIENYIEKFGNGFDKEILKRCAKNLLDKFSTTTI